MSGFFKIVGVVIILFFLSGCWGKGGAGSPMKFKRITPTMEKEMESLIEAGCDREYQYFERDVAFLYSMIPGGGLVSYINLTLPTASYVDASDSSGGG